MRFACVALLLIAGIFASSCRENDIDTPAPAADPPIAREHRAAVRLTPGTPVARQPAAVAIGLEAPSGGMPDLEPIAGADVHLVAVNRDLSWYEHFHPRLHASTWNAAITFPEAGEYVLHTIFQPKNATQIVSKEVVTVGNLLAASPRKPLAESPRTTRSGSYTVRLQTDPAPPAAGIWNSLIFTIEREGAPVTNLVPTGALGHTVILREGGEDFVYAHSTDGEAKGGIRGRAHLPATPSRSGDHSRHVDDKGPEVTFHTRFPTIGKYRMWVEFRAGEDTIKTDFVVDVGEPLPLEHKD